MKSDDFDQDKRPDQPKDGVPGLNRRTVLLGTTAPGAAAALPGGSSTSMAQGASQQAPAAGSTTQSILAKKGFKGVIKLDSRDSTPDWTPFTPNSAPDGSPNVLIVLYDDTGLASRE